MSWSELVIIFASSIFGIGLACVLFFIYRITKK